MERREGTTSLPVRNNGLGEMFTYSGNLQQISVIRQIQIYTSTGNEEIASPHGSHGERREVPVKDYGSVTWDDTGVQGIVASMRAARALKNLPERQLIPGE